MNVPINIKYHNPAQVLFGVLAISIAIGVFGAIIFEQPLLLGIPAFFLLFYLTIVDFRKVFFLLVACLPLSTEFSFPNGFGTDLPTEPLMVGLMFIYLLYTLKQGRQIDTRFLKHPITLLVLLHLGWILITTITSSLLLVSVKFLLAKTWYLVVFFFLAGRILKSERDYKIFFWYFFIPLMFTVFVTIVRHSSYNFSFADVYRVLHPFYRNHVAYAGIMAAFYPIIFLAIGWYKRFSWKWWILVGSATILIPAIYLSYTRAAYVAIFISGLTYFLFKFRLIRFVLAIALIAVIVLTTYLVQHNKYLDYAPNFEKTITHKNFDNLIEATYNFEDISTMERVHRWVAGARMFADQPLLGYGPGNFVNFYRPYTVTGFQTYVSDNEENSGIHSYYLMTLVEQGIVGLLIFLILSCYMLIKGEQIYHQAKSKQDKRLVMMALLPIIVIDAFLIINDTLETDKVGPLFFIALAVLVNLDLKNQ